MADREFNSLSPLTQIADDSQFLIVDSAGSPYKISGVVMKSLLGELLTANPAAAGTRELSKIQIGDTVYSITGSWNNLTDKPTLFSGAYADLTGKPTIPSVPARAGAFTTTFQTKLAAIETEAQKNPQNVFAMAVLPGDTQSGVADGQLGLLLSDNTNFISGSLSTVTAIQIPLRTANYNLDTSSPDVDLTTYTKHDSLFANLAERGGSILITLARRGTDTPTSVVQAETVTKASDSYVLSNLTWANPETLTSQQVNVSWNISGGMTGGILSKDILDNIPWNKISGVPIFVLLDGSNLTAQFKNDVRSPADPYTFTTPYTRRASISAAGEYSFGATPVLNGDNQQLNIWFQNADSQSAIERWLVGNEFVVADGIYKLLGTVVQVSGNQYQASVQLIKGTNLALDSASIPTLREDTPHRDEFADVAFSGDYSDLSNTPDLTDYNAVVDMMLPVRFNRTFTTGLTNTHGEATITDPTGALSQYRELALDIEETNGSVNSDVQDIGVGDWVLIEQPGNSLLVQIKHAEYSNASTAQLLYYTDSEAIKNGSIVLGAATIRASRYVVDWAEISNKPTIPVIPAGNMVVSLIGTSTSNNTNWNNIGAVSANDLLSINFRGWYSNESNNIERATLIVRAGDLPQGASASGDWLPVRAANGGARVVFRVNGGQLQAQKHGNANITEIKVYKIGETSD